ncbi:hypothetical protein [Klebsiella variicola]|uniref:hypothetical protein n=1 Tax=Klebsiella variicola TaxID=244366 RepID=UPI0011ED978A|nr:hypothetical protein [Klebsiella variicola]KAA0473360.1 hypothetical protein F0331_06160 [Klebsiella variicola]
MTTDITELAPSLKRRAASANEFGESLYIKADDVLALLEALEKAQGMETYWKTQCRGITDHCEELQARIAELESHTVKPSVHPTVASENLDDETLQELIEFRRTTFEYHSKEGNKVQTIIHGVTLAALRELQERRKADSEPVAEVVSIYGDHEAFGEREIRPLIGIQQMPYGTKLYRHVQPAPVVPDGYVMVPKVPSQAHLNSIAMRYRHDFYLLNDAQKDSALATARQMYEECSGQGFYTLPAAPQEVK